MNNNIGIIILIRQRRVVVENESLKDPLFIAKFNICVSSAGRPGSGLRVRQEAEEEEPCKPYHPHLQEGLPHGGRYFF